MLNFDLNSFNNRIGNGNTNNNFNPNYDNNTKAVLYIFSPREIPDYIVRGYKYSFDGSFYERADDIVNKQLNSFNSDMAIRNQLLEDSRELHQAITPDAFGNLFEGKRFNQFYTFLLIIDNASFEGRYNPKALQNRLLYGGYFTDEPVTQSIGGGLTFNESCAMIFTHTTQLNMKNIYTGSGTVLSARPMYDLDVINPYESMQVSPERIYLSRPEDVVSNVVINADSAMQYVADENTCIASNPNIVKVNTQLHNPKEQLNYIVSGLVKTKLDYETGQMNSVGNLRGVMLDDDLTWNQSLSKNMGSAIPDRMMGLDLRTQMFLGDLIYKYPILKYTTNVINVPWNLNDSPMLADASNPINIFSSLLMSSVPAILANFGISDAIFRYDSTDFNNTITTFNNRPMCEVFMLETFTPEESQDSIRIRWDGALKYLEENIFPIIINQVGNFSTMIKYSSAKECAVQLNLPDFTSVINDGVVMNNALFGGFQSPMVINSGLHHSNVEEFSTLSSLIRNSSSIGKVFSNRNDNPFAF